MGLEHHMVCLFTFQPLGRYLVKHTGVNNLAQVTTQRYLAEIQICNCHQSDAVLTEPRYHLILLHYTLLSDSQVETLQTLPHHFLMASEHSQPYLYWQLGSELGARTELVVQGG